VSFFTELRRRNVFKVVIAYLITAWLVMQITDVILNNVEAPGWVFQVILLLLGIGFLFAIIFSWAYEVTPQGIKRESEVDRTQSITHQTGRKLDFAIIGLLVVVVAYLLVDRLVLQQPEPIAVEATPTATSAPETAEQPGPSIAVLPFVNMSEDPGNEYFSDGLTETLLHTLAQIPDLHVAARTSSFAFKGKQTSIAEIAQALGVAHVLEGSVQKAGNRVRITAQLIRADDVFYVWSQNYDRTLDDIFAIQDEIATDVVSALDSSLLGDAGETLRGVETHNLSAYENYLKGLEQQANYSYGGLAAAEDHFKQALARDPEFTDARLALARNYLAMYGAGLLQATDARAKFEPLIAEVREKHPDNHLARMFELIGQLNLSQDVPSAELLRSVTDELRDLLQLVPTERVARLACAWYLYYWMGDSQSAIEVLQVGLTIDPLAAPLYQLMSLIYANTGRIDEALISANRAIELAPGNSYIYSSLAAIEMKRDNLPAALDWVRRAVEIDPRDHTLAANIAEILYQLELPEEGDRWYQRVIALAPGSAIARKTELQRYEARGEQDKAIAQAQAMIEDQVEGQVEGHFDEFRTAVFRYSNLMAEAGRAREAYDFLVSVWPEIKDYDTLPSDGKGRHMQNASILLLHRFESTAVAEQAWRKFSTNMDKAVPQWRERHASYSTIDLLMTGRLEEAIDDFLERSPTLPIYSFNRILDPWDMQVIPEVYSDPRVAARLQELAGQHEKLRVEIRELMQQPEWNP